MAANDPNKKIGRKKPPARPPVAGTAGTGSESDVDLSVPAGPLADGSPPSGHSVSSWTEVVRRQRAAHEGSPADDGHVEVDSPSDRDLLARADATAPSDDPDDLADHAPAFGAAHDSTHHDSGLLDVAEFGIPHRSGTEESDIRFEIVDPPSDAGGMMPLPSHAGGMGPGSDLDMFLPPLAESASGAVPFASPTKTGSSADLGAELSPTDSTRSSILDVLVSDSGEVADDLPLPAPGSSVLDYGRAPYDRPRTARPTMSGIGSEPGFDLPALPSASEGSRWGDETAPPADASSEAAADDSVDLYADSAPQTSITDSGRLAISDELVEESYRRSQLFESSSVDLSSRPSFHGSEFNVALGSAAQPSGTDGDIDMDFPSVGDPAGTSVVMPRALDHNQAALAAEFEARRRQQDRNDAIQPARPADDEARRLRLLVRDGMLRGSVLGLLLGCGGFFAAWATGILPNRMAQTAGSNAAADPAALTKAREEGKKESAAALTKAEEAKTTADAAVVAMNKSLSDAGVIDPARIGDTLKSLTAARTVAESKVKDLTTEVGKAKETAETARAAEATARKGEDAAKKSLADSAKAVDTAKADAEVARKEAIAAKVAADGALAGVAKVFKDAGLDPAKPDEALKAVIAARDAAEEKAKTAAADLAKADAKAADLTKAADAAAKAKLTADATLASVAERLTKAKFVGDRPDSAALLKGVDDALKAAGTDATAALRDELAKARLDTTKLKADADAAVAKEAEVAKKAMALKDEAARLAAELKVADTKAAKETAAIKAELDEAKKKAADLVAKNDVAAATAAAQTAIAEKAKAIAEKAKLDMKATSDKREADLKANLEKVMVDNKIAADQAAASRKDLEDKLVTETAKLAKAATEAADKAAAAEKVAAAAKSDADKATAEMTKLKSANDQLARNLKAAQEAVGTVRPSTSDPIIVKADSARVADKLFGDGLAAFHAGKSTDAEAAFRKAVQLNEQDARFHYLLGLSLWGQGDTKAAEAAFAKGREMELAGRPAYKSINAVLERVQGPARQAVSAFRP